MAGAFFLLLEVPGLPALVDRRLRRSVEPEDDEVSLAGHGGEPVSLLARGCFRPEIELRAPVGVLDRLVTRTERGERLAVGETRGVLSLVERQRPEVRGRYLGRQVQAIVLPPDRGAPWLSVKAIMYLAPLPGI